MRYKGSYLGILWSLLTPIFMLIVYTFVFGVIFEARWGLEAQDQREFALILFCGLVIFGVVSDTLVRAPGIILANINYVKKVVFPTEILPVTIIGSALFNGLVGFMILIIAQLIVFHTFHWTVILLPIVLLPLVMSLMGVTWLLASIGVFFRDIGHVINVIVSGLMFLSPIFYPLTAVPEQFRIFLFINPLTYVVEEGRKVILWGTLPDWNTMLTGFGLSFILMILGYYWFQYTKEGFADVL